MARKPDVQYIRFVTDGSSARVAEQAPVRAKTKLPKVKKQRVKDPVIYVDPLAFTAVVLSCVMLVLMVVNCVQLQNYQNMANQMDDYVDTLKEENARLTDIYNKNIDLKDIEEKALALGLVPIEEVRHVTVAVDKTVVTEQTDAPQWGVLTGVVD